MTQTLMLEYKGEKIHWDSDKEVFVWRSPKRVRTSKHIAAVKKLIDEHKDTGCELHALQVKVFDSTNYERVVVKGRDKVRSSHHNIRVDIDGRVYYVNSGSLYEPSEHNLMILAQIAQIDEQRKKLEDEADALRSTMTHLRVPE